MSGGVVLTSLIRYSIDQQGKMGGTWGYCNHLLEVSPRFVWVIHEFFDYGFFGIIEIYLVGDFFGVFDLVIKVQEIGVSCFDCDGAGPSASGVLVGIEPERVAALSAILSVEGHTDEGAVIVIVAVGDGFLPKTGFK